MLNKHNFPTEYSICSKTDVFNFLSNINDTSGFFSKEKNFKTYFPQLYEDFKKIEFPDFTYKWKFSQKLYHIRILRQTDIDKLKNGINIF